MSEDTRQAAIERAVKAATLALLSRDQTVAEIVAALTGAVTGGPADITPRESVAAVRQSRRDKMVSELIRLEQEGRGRPAAMLVARKFASDPLDLSKLKASPESCAVGAARKTDSVRILSLKQSRFTK